MVKGHPSPSPLISLLDLVLPSLCNSWPNSCQTPTALLYRSLSSFSHFLTKNPSLFLSLLFLSLSLSLSLTTWDVMPKHDQREWRLTGEHALDLWPRRVPITLGLARRLPNVDEGGACMRVARSWTHSDGSPSSGQFWRPKWVPTGSSWPFSSQQHPSFMTKVPWYWHTFLCKKDKLCWWIQAKRSLILT